VRVLAARGAVEAQAGRDEEAAATFGRGVFLAPRSTELRRKLALVLARLGRHREAAWEYEQILLQDPLDLPATAGLARLLREDPDAAPSAVAVFRRLLLRGPEYAHLAATLVGAAAASAVVGDVPEVLHEACTRFPQAAPLWEASAELGRATADHELEISARRRLVELAASDPKRHQALGEAHERAGQEEAALACYLRALDLAPDDQLLKERIRALNEAQVRTRLKGANGE